MPILRAVLLAACVALAGCATPPPPPRDKSALAFDETSPDALVVVGFAVDAPASAINVSMTWTCHNPETGAICPKRDPDGPKNMFGVSQRFLGFGLVKDRARSTEAFETIERNVLRVPPGDYILDDAHRVDFVLGGYPSWTTKYADRDRTSADTKAPRFRATPGKAHYLGDFRLQFFGNPAKIQRTMDLAAAQRELETYPNVRGRLAPVTLKSEN